MPTVTGSPLVARQALLESLDRGVAGPVTLVTASAGSGKTLLVRSWLDSRAGDRLRAWIAVDRGERDAQHFWRSVITELSAATSGVMAIEAGPPTPDFAGEAVVERLISELAALAAELVVVIDDLHELEAEEARTQLAYFLDRLPENVHVVLISRRDAHLGLHRRRLDGELTEIRSADLRFTPAETREMLTGLGVALSPDSLQQLHDRTEGWAAGLRLAAMSLVAQPDPEAFVAEFSGSERTVAEYLLAEVLERQPEHVRRLLMRVSILERVNGALADRLTGDTGAERELQAMADAGGFVVALDASRSWFRFHHLFADLLALELRNSEPSEIPRLHALAARWFAENGFAVEAISHAEAAGERQLAAGLLTEHYFSLTLDGRRATARALLERLDPDAVAGSPELAVVVAAEQLVDGSLDQAATHLAVAELHREEVPEPRRRRFEMVRLVSRLSLARRLGDFRTVLDELSSAVTDDAPKDSTALSADSDVRSLALMNLGIVEVWSGRLAEGESHLSEALSLARQAGRPYLELECRAHLAQVTAWESFPRAGVASREVIEEAERLGWGSDPVVSPALVTLGAALLQVGRFEEAEQWLTRAGHVVRAEVEPAVGFLLYLAMGGLRMAAGRYADAIESFRAAQRLGLLLVDDSPLARQAQASLLRATLGLGDVGAVRAALAEMAEADREADEIREVVAALALADGDPDAALAALAPVASGDANSHRGVVLVRSLLLTARAYDALREAAASEAAIERALDIAERDGVVLPFLHVPSRDLLERHPRHRSSHGALVKMILDVMAGAAPPPPAAPAAPLLEPLTEMELRVLRYLPTNLSASEIGGEIYVSVNTVKTHMRHLYAKLDVHTRADAVTRARELGLLAQGRRRS